MHEADQIQSSPRGNPNGAQDEYQPCGPEYTAPTNLTPSSSRPPPAHPILKKPRGPSNSGPRPTARFVDVPDSEEETSVQNGGGSSSSSSISSLQQGTASPFDTSTATSKSHAAPSRSRSPAAKSERKIMSGKKFVALTTTSKRRPVLPRRQSSQSSTGSVGSEAGSRDGSKQATSQGSNSSSRDNSPSRRQGSSGVSSHGEGREPKTKAPEKRSVSDATTEKRFTGRPSPHLGARNSSATASRMTSSPLAQEPYTDSHVRLPSRPERLTPRSSELSPNVATSWAKPTAARAIDSLGSWGKSLEPLKSTTTLSKAMTVDDTPAPVQLENGPKSVPQPGTSVPAQSQSTTNGAPAMTRSKSHESRRTSTHATAPSANFKSPSVVGMSSIAVTGGFDFETPQARLLDEELPVLGADQPDIRKPSMLDSRFVPTQPSSSPALPMARSKSQLTLLLERNKARIGDKHKFGSSSSSQKGGAGSGGKK